MLIPLKTWRRKLRLFAQATQRALKQGAVLLRRKNIPLFERDRRFIRMFPTAAFLAQSVKTDRADCDVLYDYNS
ncbi:hypothetical protein BJF95_18090 [Rhizobium oryziradicis]|uniref:Uncharacterized protein n=1 Tax=Rhizobium oryziradicis TaxID=1867956 RepID=A0A1Q8ZT11_9HYPH|nr:hypothetical protein BJF95_18090 [Rhizobium oryziradicis]